MTSLYTLNTHVVYLKLCINVPTYIKVIVRVGIQFGKRYVWVDIEG